MMTKTYVIEMKLTVDAADEDQATSRARYAVDYLCRDRGHVDYVRGAVISSAHELGDCVPLTKYEISEPGLNGDSVAVMAGSALEAAQWFADTYPEASIDAMTRDEISTITRIVVTSEDGAEFPYDLRIYSTGKVGVL